ARCRARWNCIAKPLYGLGVLEDLVVRIAAAQGTDQVDISRKGLVVFCADNGVVDEGVSQTGQEVTAIVAENFIDGKSCTAIMCKRAGADLYPVDVGIAVDTPRVEKRKCRRGTANMTKGPAMTRGEAVFAIEAGIAKAQELEEAGYRILASGEMGIGNTTTSTAVTAVLLGLDPTEVTGRGAGLSDEGLRKKIDAIHHAIAVNQPDPEDPLDVLSKVGGFDIAALTGLFLGGASRRVPVVIDGVISAAAALIAARLEPSCRDYMLPSHISEEPASMAVMTALGFIPEKQETKQGKADREKDSMKKVPGPAVSPILHAGMHLGEGTGAVALFPLLDMAVDIYYKMDTFEGIAVEKYRDYDAE
ncbi:MAG: nicotinate-nucleotide--dimethylbenzimidazole phosphoribosyltransferase, partial [Sarcina sp.]|nr:nicotinate-nucleotide--dimethylbenzimidazole phosphoribosyltransferase [Sarcina sp.]